MMRATWAKSNMPKDEFSKFKSDIESDIDKSSKEGYGGLHYGFDEFSASNTVLGRSIRDYYVSRNAFFKFKRDKYSTRFALNFDKIVFDLEHHGYRVNVKQFGDPYDRSYVLVIMWQDDYPIDFKRLG